MHCSKCGKKIDFDATFCQNCGSRLELKNDNKKALQGIIENGITNKDNMKKYIIIGIFIVVALIYILVFRCKAGFCLLPSTYSGDYCSVHTCDRDNCYNKVAEGQNYCYTHMPSTSTKYTYTPEVAEKVLAFSDINISKNSSYTICTATITNNGKKTYSFVEVKGKFKDSSGTILDTDWTYAVGSEGLAPGESTSFRLSVDRNSNITKCELEILDYDRE